MAMRMINREIQEDLEDFIHFRGMELPGLTRLVCDERRSPVDISRAEIALTLEYGVPVISAVGHSGKPNLISAFRCSSRMFGQFEKWRFEIVGIVAVLPIEKPHN